VGSPPDAFSTPTAAASTLPQQHADHGDRAAQQARGVTPVPDGALVGQPAPAGRTTGPVHLMPSPDDGTRFAAGDGGIVALLVAAGRAGVEPP